MRVSAIGEYDYEPIRGLPGRLPPGEALLWQGAPDVRAVARRILHVRLFGAYLAAMLLVQLGTVLTAGRAARHAAVLSAGLFLALALAALVIIAVLAWLIARTTVYSITSRRVVLRFGVAFPMSVNVPLRIVQEASLKSFRAGDGELALTLNGDGRLAWLHLWPHVRPWHLARPQPAMRGLKDATAVSDLLCALLAEPAPREETAASPPADLPVSIGHAAEAAA